ncbi:DNA recombinase [Corynebacterium terpenotabidum Y-11]|uniref:DNA recombinase n=1 Tax=Corynebacterium terpenotabidum Y-11 TaxID=1200352 RepID=S4XHN8_9CORY|nr:DNA recombinase [Corynebacterium terpenotabidum Y-11]
MSCAHVSRSTPSSSRSFDGGLGFPIFRTSSPHADEPRLREIKDKINEHRAKIRRAQRDYDDELIEGLDLKRVRDRVNAAIDTLEVERLRLSLGRNAHGVVSSKDPVAAFDNGDLATRRSTIEVLCEVRLHHHPRGRKTFNPDTVTISWR